MTQQEAHSLATAFVNRLNLVLSLLFLKALQQESFDRNTVTDKLHEILKKVKPNI